MSTITDVARLANVSLSTVSNVINGTKPVSDATRKKVEDAIRKVNFTPHSVAQSLRRGTTHSIGLVASDTSQFIFGQMVARIEQEVRQWGHTLLIANSGEDREQERKAVRVLLDRKVDGLVLAPAADSDPAVIEDCDRAGCPVVLIDRTTLASRDQVGVQNRAAMRVLVEHLIALGHDRIALVAGDVGVWTIRERVEGFRDAMEAADLVIGPGAIVETGRGLNDGRTVVEELLRSRERPTAIVAASGLLTLGTLRALRATGIKYPRDVALVSFDGVMNSEFFESELTCTVQPVDEIGAWAIRLLQRRMVEPSVSALTVMARPSAFHGTSCGCEGRLEFGLDHLDEIVETEQ